MSSMAPSKRSAQIWAPVEASMSCPVIHAVRRLAHAAFEHITHAKLTTHLLHVHRPPLVGEARIARDHEEPTQARQGRDDFLHHAVRKVVLLRIVAHVGEWQDGNRGPVGESQCRPRLLRCGLRCIGRFWLLYLLDGTYETHTLAGQGADEALVLSAVVNRAS